MGIERIAFVMIFLKMTVLVAALYGTLTDLKPIVRETGPI